MKILAHIIIILSFIIYVPAFAEKKDCSKLKKFSKNHIACKAHNLKTGTKKTAGKIKEKTGNIFKATTGILKKDK
tara:strand:- start:1686 stop:1910 length:225 start_codon:yes stop_codon:yes gene_type:complete